MKNKLVLLFLALTLILSACSSGENEHKDDHSEHTLPNGDLQEETASVEVLPNFLKDKPEEMQMVYAAAGKATDVLEWIPCYCGCGESAGHLNNKNCFVNKINEDGTVVWDDHGTRCLVCMEIAVESIKMKQEGKSLKEIRETIDNKYNEGYAAPTNTPMPS
jgi:hypothetical protein